MRMGQGVRTGLGHNFLVYNMKICCMFSLELPHRGDSYEYTQYIFLARLDKVQEELLYYPRRRH